MLRSLALLIACSALYGFTLGYGHSLLYATRNLLKLPLLFLATGTVCSLAYLIVARALSARLSAVTVTDLVLRMFRDTAVLLAGLSPASLFLAWIARHGDDGRLGDYYLLLGINTLFVALAGSLALCRQARDLCRDHAIPRRTGIAIVSCWLALSLFVGGQASWYLRPLFGVPATRGGSPPFALGTEPDLRGATNFYEAILQILADTPLPERLR